MVRAVEGVSSRWPTARPSASSGRAGCGKSTLGLSILKLLRPPGRIAGGRILYRGRDILTMGERELLALRGRSIAMIFQNPLTSLDPLLRVDRHFLETIRRHEPGVSAAAARQMHWNWRRLSLSMRGLI